MLYNLPRSKSAKISSIRNIKKSKVAAWNIFSMSRPEIVSSEIVNRKKTFLWFRKMNKILKIEKIFRFNSHLIFCPSGSAHSLRWTAKRKPSNKNIRKSFVMWGYVYLERAVGKNEKLENFKLESPKWDWKDWSWKIPTEVGKFELNLANSGPEIPA